MEAFLYVPVAIVVTLFTIRIVSYISYKRNKTNGKN